MLITGVIIVVVIVVVAFKLVSFGLELKVDFELEGLNVGNLGPTLVHQIDLICNLLTYLPVRIQIDGVLVAVGQIVLNLK